MKKNFLIVLIVLCSSILAKAQVLSDLFGTPARSYIGLQVGTLSFYGDVRPTVGHNWLSGKPGAKLDYMLELGEDGLFAVKLGFTYGVLNDGLTRIWGSTEVPLVDDISLYPPYDNDPDAPNYQYKQLSSYEEGHLNFRTNLYVVGLQGEYRIRNIPGFRSIYPYISTGVNLIIFNPQADRLNGDIPYEDLRLTGWQYYPYPNPDRQRPYSYPDDYLWAPGQLPTADRDQIYETDLKTANLYGQGSFSGITVGFPLEVGVDFRVMPNVNIRLGTSFTFTLTDNIDGVSGQIARSAKFNPALGYDAPVNRASRLQTNKYNDFYAYTYAACYIYLPFL